MKKKIALNRSVIVSGLALALMFSVVILRPSLGQTIIVYGAPVASSGSLGSCPGSFSGYITYTQAPPAWGWAPATNATKFTAVNGGQRTDVRVEFNGVYGDSGCNLTNVTIPNPPTSPKYQFSIYFRSSPPPTTNYPIILTGFNTNK